jgi:4-hydroxybenzoate polyprenyltransferase
MQRTRRNEVGPPAWRVLRPRQWVKNVFVLAPLVFAQELANAAAVEAALLAFFLFCVLSSSVYVLNDLVDAESDRRHPDKRHRPIASGELDPRAAGGAGRAAGHGGPGRRRLPGHPLRHRGRRPTWP